MQRDRFRLDPDLVSAVRARFGKPAFDTAAGASARLAADRSQSRPFDAWVETNIRPHREAAYLGRDLPQARDRHPRRCQR